MNEQLLVLASTTAASVLFGMAVGAQLLRRSDWMRGPPGVAGPPGPAGMNGRDGDSWTPPVPEPAPAPVDAYATKEAALGISPYGHEHDADDPANVFAAGMARYHGTDFGWATPDANNYVPEQTLIGLHIQHQGNLKEYKITGFAWQGQSDTWGFVHERVDGSAPVLVRPMSHLTGRLSDGRLRYLQIPSEAEKQGIDYEADQLHSPRADFLTK